MNGMRLTTLTLQGVVKADGDLVGAVGIVPKLRGNEKVLALDDAGDHLLERASDFRLRGNDTCERRVSEICSLCTFSDLFLGCARRTGERLRGTLTPSARGTLHPTAAITRYVQRHFDTMNVRKNAPCAQFNDMEEATRQLTWLP